MTPNMETLAGAVKAVRDLEKLQLEVIRRARKQGATWREIAGVLGISHQAVWSKYHELVDE